jgi:hypothetical protein
MGLRIDPTKRDFGTSLMEGIDLVAAFVQRNRDQLREAKVADFTRDDLARVVAAAADVLDSVDVQLDVLREFVAGARKAFSERS